MANQTLVLRAGSTEETGGYFKSIASNYSLISLSSQMDLLERKRAAYGGSITRTYNKYNKILHEKPDSVDMAAIAQQIESINNTDKSYRQVHLEMALEFHNEIDFGDKKEVPDVHEESVERTLLLGLLRRSQ